MKPERLVTLPLEAARIVGAGVLWLTERLVPAEPSIETKAANISYYRTGDKK